MFYEHSFLAMLVPKKKKYYLHSTKFNFKYFIKTTNRDEKTKQIPFALFNYLIFLYIRIHSVVNSEKIKREKKKNYVILRGVFCALVFLCNLLKEKICANDTRSYKRRKWKNFFPKTFLILFSFYSLFSNRS